MSDNSKKILVTGYENPDIDAAASAVAYAEFLRKKGFDALAGLFGRPHREAQFVLKKFNIKTPKRGEKLLKYYKNIILVDASELKGISKKIAPKNVVEKALSIKFKNGVAKREGIIMRKEITPLLKEILEGRNT